MTWADWWTLLLAVPGVFFLSVGTLGLLRLDDLHSRIHALTKADTLGLGLIVLAVLPHAGSVGAAAKMLLVWGLALVSAAAIAHLLARGAEPQGLAEDEPTRLPAAGDQAGTGPDAQESTCPSGEETGPGAHETGPGAQETGPGAQETGPGAQETGPSAEGRA